MFDSPSEIRALVIRALCEESVHYCFDPQTGATLIQPWKVQSFTNQERDPMNVLRSVEWRVTWPQGLTMELLVLSIKLSMSSSFLYSPEKQRNIVQAFMGTIEKMPSRDARFTPKKQRTLMKQIAQDPAAALPKNYLAELLASSDDQDEDEAAEEKRPAAVVAAAAAPVVSSQPPLSQEQPAEEEEDF